MPPPAARFQPPTRRDVGAAEEGQSWEQLTPEAALKSKQADSHFREEAEGANTTKEPERAKPPGAKKTSKIPAPCAPTKKPDGEVPGEATPC